VNGIPRSARYASSSSGLAGSVRRVGRALREVLRHLVADVLLEATDDEPLVAEVLRRVIVGIADRRGVQQRHQRGKAARRSVVRRGRQQHKRVGPRSQHPIRKARPSMPDSLNDRALDSWEPLLAIAEIAGRDWPKQARAAALALSGGVDPGNDTLGVQLLSDIRDVIKDYEDDIQRTDKEGDALRTAVIIDRLCAIEDHPWATASKGKAITAELLAKKLKPFSVKPKQYWVDGKKERGYLLNDLKDPFHRYLADQPGRPGRTQAECGSQPFSQPGMGPGHTGYENRPEPSCGAGPTGSTGCERGNGGEGVSGDRDTGLI
jgi:hypothetical protein